MLDSMLLIGPVTRNMIYNIYPIFTRHCNRNQKLYMHFFHSQNNMHRRFSDNDIYLNISYSAMINQCCKGMMIPHGLTTYVTCMCYFEWAMLVQCWMSFWYETESDWTLPELYIDFHMLKKVPGGSKYWQQQKW